MNSEPPAAGQAVPAAPGAEGVIEVASHHEAMELSLVLASQGMEPLITRDPEARWLLIVPGSEHGRARETIAQYVAENRRWTWRARVALHDYVFDGRAGGWAGFIIALFALDGSLRLRDSGVMDPALVGRGEWWRLFTAVWLHADISHLAANASLGVLFLGLAMGRFGAGPGLLAAYLAGVVGNLGPWLIGLRNYQSLGASGMVMGALGLLAGQTLQAGAADRNRAGLQSVAAGVMLLALFGLSPGSDVLAHLGGFVGGLLIGSVLGRFSTREIGPAPNLAAGLILGLLIVLPWGLALRHARHP